MNREPHGLVAVVRRFVGPDRAWVGAQLALLALGAGGGIIEVALRGRGIPSGPAGLTVGAGGLLLAASGVVLLKSQRDLADNLTMSPTPLDEGHLVDQGIYGVVRHPMYLGVLLAMCGYALVIGSRVALLVAIVLVPFLLAKARHEEHLLLARYPAYRSYRDRVRWRFLPGLL